MTPGVTWPRRAEVTGTARRREGRRRDTAGVAVGRNAATPPADALATGGHTDATSDYALVFFPAVSPTNLSARERASVGGPPGRPHEGQPPTDGHTHSISTV